MSPVRSTDANGWTAVSSRHSDGSKPKRSITFSSNTFWPSIGNVRAATGALALRACGGDERHLLLLQPLEDRADLGRLHPGLEVVEEDVVRLVVVVEAVDIAAAQVEVRAKGGQELREVGVLPRLDPDRHRERGGADISARSSAGTRRAFSQSRRTSRIRLASFESYGCESS